MRRRIVIGVILAAALVSCSGPERIEGDQILLERSECAVISGVKDMIDFEGSGFQYSSNSARHVYRATTEITSTDVSTGNSVSLGDEYFVLRLDAAVPEEKATVTGSLYLQARTIKKGSTDYKNLEFKVLRRTSEMAWLWDETRMVGVVIHLD